MNNLDTVKLEMRQGFQAALESDSQEALVECMVDFAVKTQEGVLELAESVQGDIAKLSDDIIHSKRGTKPLDSNERKYWEAVIDGMRTGTPMNGVTVVPDAMPTTIVNTIIEDMKQAHPLLDLMKVTNTGVITRFISSAQTGVFAWGELTAEITSELTGAISADTKEMAKGSAFIAVANAMLDLGPEWIDLYVRTIISEATALGLENAIVDGDGKDKPHGMDRKLTGDTSGVYPLKTAMAITEFTPATLGPIMATLSTGPAGNQRATENFVKVLVANPTDYWGKVYPATTLMGPQGGYFQSFPIGNTKILEAVGVPSGKAIFGLVDRYRLGLATGKDGNIEFSDQYRFLEDQRVYRVKIYGDGRALDENAFVLLNIANLEPIAYKTVAVGGKAEGK